MNVAIRDAVVAGNELIDAVRAGAPIDEAVFSRIEAARRPEVEKAQAGQIRAGSMVMKPTPVLHAAFTMIGTMIALFAPRHREGHGAPDDVVLRHAVPVTPASG